MSDNERQVPNHTQLQKIHCTTNGKGFVPQKLLNGRYIDTSHSYNYYSQRQ